MTILPLAAQPGKGDDSIMFSVYCSGHAAEVLLFPGDIRSVVNHPHGIDVHWRCPCGEEGVWRTGSPRPARSMPAGR